MTTTLTDTSAETTTTEDHDAEPAVVSKRLEAKERRRRERAENEQSQSKDEPWLRGAMARIREAGAEDKRRRGRRGSMWDRSRALLLRSLVLLADYLLAVVTAMGVIPTMGAWLHEESGASMGQLTSDGTVAMWLVPLCFLVILLAAGEIALMRGMWRWSSGVIERMRDRREAEDEPQRTEAAEPKTAPRTTTKKKTTKRSR